MKNSLRPVLGLALLVAAGLLTTSPSSAQQTIPATFLGSVDVVRVDADGRGLIYFATGSRTELLLGCEAAEQLNALAFNVNTPGGDAIYRLVTSAFLSGKKLKAAGSGACNIYSTTQSFLTASILP